jgi:hypothetical protein
MSTVLVSETTILAAPDTDNVLQTRDGRVTLRVPPGALHVAATISHQPIFTTARSSVLYPFELNARRQDGVSLTTFARPLPLTLHYSGLLTRSLDPSERLFIVTFNEQTRQWEEIRTTHDRANQTLSVELKHFSTYGIGQSNASMTQETLPSVRGMGQVDLFSGAASFNFPIQLPAGPGGFQPSLALHYSTSAVNDRTLNSNNTLGLYLGDGWKLSDLPMVIRNSNGTPTNDADDSFFSNYRRQWAMASWCIGPPQQAATIIITRSTRVLCASRSATMFGISQRKMARAMSCHP